MTRATTVANPSAKPGLARNEGRPLALCVGGECVVYVISPSASAAVAVGRSAHLLGVSAETAVPDLGLI